VPLYEFECPRCGARFEELVRVGGVAPCARCEENETRRLFSPVAAPHKWHIDRGRARDSDTRRAEREARRVERFAEQRSRRRAGGGELSGGPS